MTAPRDPAVPAIGIVIAALADAYREGSSFPPDHPTSEVRFFAGEGPATAAWNAHTSQAGCDAPFLWVRVQRRFRTESLPTPTDSPNPCRLPRAVAVEVGVGRCALLAEDPSWEDYEAEAVTSLEDSWRIEAALCVATSRLRSENYLVSTEPIEPYGPEGGIMAWTGTIAIQFAD